jgi:pimeloyl-ACP methyl ester carboxylesterase
MTTPDFEPEAHLVRSFDGTFVAVRSIGAGAAPPLLLINPVGGTTSLWHKALFDLARERTIVAWDHRGLYESGPAASGRIDARAHAQDALAAVEHYGGGEFVIVAWSNGVRIALELVHLEPDRVLALAAVCGGYAHSPSAFLRNLNPSALLPPMAGITKHFASLLQAPLRALVARPEITGVIRQSGLVGANADTAALVGLLQAMASCDLDRLLATYEAVAGDDGRHLLSGVTAPTLIVAGERDAFTPRAVSEEMERSIPGATLEVYEGATHYVPIEFPGRLSTDLREFFSQISPPQEEAPNP